MVKMHSNEMEDINEANAGEIFAIFGLDCATGDTLCDGNNLYGFNLKRFLLYEFNYNNHK